MNDKLQKFMYGRYGVDSLNMVLLFLSLILSLVFRLFHIPLLTLFPFLLTILAIYRTFSRNIEKRRQEGLKWNAFSLRLTGQLKKKTHYISDLSKYKYFTCSNCKQKLRIPRGKGKVEVRCPKCGNSFQSRS